jgi:hypothetical protein
MSDRPTVVIIAGPNGAGKSTAAPAILRDFAEMSAFVNADVIAQGLSAFDPESEAIEAGRIMLRRMHEFAAQRQDFAFETTLASRTFATWLERAKRDQDYRVFLYYVWVRSADEAVRRVRSWRMANREALDRLFADPAIGAEIGNRGIQQALREHKLLGHSIIVWQDGRVVELPPEEIPVDVTPPPAREPRPAARQLEPVP